MFRHRHGFHHHHHHRHGWGGWGWRPFWRPRRYYRPMGCCGCLPLVGVFMTLGLVMLLSTLCSAPSYYWYGF